MITFDRIIKILKTDANFRSITRNEPTDIEFDALSYDSRTVSPTTLFFAKGLAFKKEFLEKAIENGFTYYVSEIGYEVGIPAIIVKDIKQAMSLIAMKSTVTHRTSSNSWHSQAPKAKQPQLICL